MISDNGGVCDSARRDTKKSRRLFSTEMQFCMLIRAPAIAPVPERLDRCRDHCALTFIEVSSDKISGNHERERIISFILLKGWRDTNSQACAVTRASVSRHMPSLQFFRPREATTFTRWSTTFAAMDYVSQSHCTMAKS